MREFVELAFDCVGRRIEWRGSGVEEKGVDARTGEALVEVDPRYFRPTEVESLRGDAGKAQKELGWRHRTSFPELVREMVESDLAAASRGNRAGNVD